MRVQRNNPKENASRRDKQKSQVAQPGRAAIASNSSGLQVADVKPYVRTLLRAPMVSDPASREAEINIKQIADACGLYLTASFIHSYSNSLPPAVGGEKKNIRPRGFELAGELYYLHLHKEVNLIEENEKSIGPIVFGDYCTELFDCFLAGEHVRKGVGYPIMLMESLLNKALTLPDNKSLYLALADQAMQSMEELSRRKFNRDNKDSWRAIRTKEKDDVVKSEMRSPHEIIDQELFDHLQGLQKILKNWLIVRTTCVWL